MKMSTCFCVHMCSCRLPRIPCLFTGLTLDSEIRAAGRACNQGIVYSSYEEVLFI